MSLRWLVALAVVLTLVWAGAVLAGPSRPAGGDPDIWERSKPAPNTPTKAVASLSSTADVVDMVVFRASLRQQDARNKSDARYSELPSLHDVSGRR